MAYFHYRCGERITLLNDNCTAVRNDSDFDNGLVITAEPLVSDVLFEVKIDRKVNSWSGSLEIGVVECDPLHFEFPACSTKVQGPSWIMSGTSFFRNCSCVIEHYGFDLDKLNQDDRVGVMRTSEGDLIFYVNGESQGVACENIPSTVYGIIDVYGKCVQVTITSPILREHNNDDCLSGSSVLAIDNDNLNVTLGNDLSELSMSSSNSLDIRMDMNVSLSLPEECPRPDKIRFHDRCGSLVKLSNGNRTAERRRPLDEFNNGVVMTHRPLKDGELFEIRIDRLVDKWSGSIEMGITTHNPNTLVFPATMTNMRSGTIMMSGCGILTNGKGTRREYGDFNLDELSEGDRVGMMRKSDGNLHYFINGLDQGVAAQRVPSIVWGVIDLYGMTIKVSIVERDEREEQNLITRKNTRDHQVIVLDPQPMPDYYDRLTFHPNCGTHAQVINNGRTAHRPNAADDFNNGVVLTARPLKTGELFEVRLDRVVTKWAGSIEIGVTTHSPVDLEFPFTMTNVRSGTWMMTGSGIMHNGSIVLEQYGVNLDRLQVGDRVGVVRKENGLLHFFVNGIDQGAAASNIPEKVYGVIDLYGQAVEASIIDMYDYGSPDTINSSLSNTTLYSDLRFHHVHGKNALIVNSGLTALRPRPLSEFNDAIVFSNRPLRDGELFEVTLDTIVDRWSGSIELGVTAVKPDDIELPGTATDLCQDTWMLSGSSIMANGTTIKNNYPCDLDSLGAGVRVGVLRSSDKTLEFYKDGIPQGPACIVPHSNVYAVVDLYGQCAKVSIPGVSPIAQATVENIRSETSLSLTGGEMMAALLQNQPECEGGLHVFSEFHGRGVVLSNNGRSAKRGKDLISGIVASASFLPVDELFEVTINSILTHLAGSIVIGLTDVPPSNSLHNNVFPDGCICVLSENEFRFKNKTIQFFSPNLYWLTVGDKIGFLRSREAGMKIIINGEDLPLIFPKLPDKIYISIDLRGACNSISITSQTPTHNQNKLISYSPLNTNRLQDSLEIPTNTSQDHNDPPSNSLELPLCSDNISIDLQQNNFYEFHENHGRNIELFDNKTSARRVASYNQGVVIIQPALEINAKVQIGIEVIETKWKSSIVVGLISAVPEKITLPANALGFKAPCCIVSDDWISINGVKSQSNYGQKLNDLKCGDSVGVILTETGLRLIINNIEEDILPIVFQPGHLVYAVFDLYGQCQQIKIINDVNAQELSESLAVDLEKADLERCEKDALTLPIPSASTSLTLLEEEPLIKLSPIPIPQMLVNVICPYKEECIKMKKRLLLPEFFFSDDEPICYCTDCFKIRAQQQSDESAKDNYLEGFVKFVLARSDESPQTDTWHTAFYPTKLGLVRQILDIGQPFTKGQSDYGLFSAKEENDVLIVFYSNLQGCQFSGFKLKDSNKEAHVAFELLVKPGAYTVSKEPSEWNTKEAGAIVLNSLLLQIKPA